MSKEIEHLEDIKNATALYHSNYGPKFDIIEQALQRLEAIDNTSPSKALELVGCLKEHHLNTIPYYDWLNDIEKYILKAQQQDFNNSQIVMPFFDELIKLLGTNDTDEMLDKIKEQGKVLKIIKEKNVDIWLLKSCLTVEQYNFGITQMDKCNVFNLTEEEFDTLKEWMK